MNRQMSNEVRYEDEIDMMELVMILVREKKTILVTFLIVVILSFWGALYEMDKSKEAIAVITLDLNENKFSQNEFLSSSILEKVYQENKIREKENLTVDEFRNRFKIEGIIPKNIKDKKELLEKQGEEFKYTPKSYVIKLRVGSPKESEIILNSYYLALNNYFKIKNESKYQFKSFDVNILKDKTYDYEDYLTILESRKKGLKELIKNRDKINTDYSSYGFGYRQITTELQNLEDIRIQELQNYLIATNIVKNVDNFRSEFNNKKDILKNTIDQKKKDAANVQELLKSYSGNSKSNVVPKGVKISTAESGKDIYYTVLVDNYLNLQMEIARLQMQLEELDLKNKNLTNGTEIEREYIVKTLQNIVLDYNRVVILANRLENLENYIQNGALVKLAAPIEVISSSKAKLILGVGIVMGIFLGIMMAFFKTFYHSFKKFHKGLQVLAIFLLIGINGYSKEEVTINFLHKDMISGLNPDKTPFNLEENLIKNFYITEFNLTESELKDINIIPIYPKESYKEVEKKLRAGEESIYTPTEYRVIFNLKNIKLEEKLVDLLKNRYPTYYTDYFLKNDNRKITYDYTKSYSTYRESLKAMNNFIDGLYLEMSNRKKDALNKEKFYEYNNLEIELNKIKDTKYRDIVNYIVSNKIVLNKTLEQKLLAGENKNLNLKIKALEDIAKNYNKILKDYNLSESQGVILESGDVSLSSGGSVKEEQYIELSRKYLETLKEENVLKRRLIENKKFSFEMIEPTKIQKEKIYKDLQELQSSIDNIFERMRFIELKEYRREYLDSVKVF